MQKQIAAAACGVVLTAVAWTAVARGADAPVWNPRAAASYLDQRADWWTTWPGAARDHDTFCVSCHTAAPYAVARPVLRRTLGEAAPSAAETRLAANVVKRVRMWREVEPFYPDQTRGIPKTSESRGTESILNALVLASRDAAAGSLSDDARHAFDNMWALQMKTGDHTGAWTWLNFHYEPWEAERSPYYGATLAAVAVGMAPDHYAASAEIQDRLKPLRSYLQKGADTQHLFNRINVLWASTLMPDLLTAEQQRSIVDAIRGAQSDDGGWTMARFADWKRIDNTSLDGDSDGLATGLATFVLQAAGVSRDDAAVRRGRAWLTSHQQSGGSWFTASLNKERDPQSDAGKFMSDAGTAYAVLALTR
jgi:squalene-hopene/tetraprenyl-beta-curcumene cyclase